MFYVFDHRDFPWQGIVVDTEAEAISCCENDFDLVYVEVRDVVSR